MPRKHRKKKRNQTAELTSRQFFDLLLSESPNKDIWPDKLQRRVAWYAHRGGFINEDKLRSSPGRRPGGWWTYESKEPRPFSMDRAEWESLLQQGEMDKAELQLVVAEWIGSLHRQQGSLKMLYETRKQGRKPYHDRRDWTDHCETYDRQAALLGDQALQEWQRIRDRLADDWNEKGCSSCPEFTKSCTVTDCQHYHRLQEGENENQKRVKG